MISPVCKINLKTGWLKLYIFNDYFIVCLPSHLSHAKAIFRYAAIVISRIITSFHKVGRRRLDNRQCFFNQIPFTNRRTKKKRGCFSRSYNFTFWQKNYANGLSCVFDKGLWQFWQCCDFGCYEQRDRADRRVRGWDDTANMRFTHF